MKTLDDFAVGSRVRIGSALSWSPSTQRLAELGLVDGAVVELIRRASFGSPIEIRVLNTRICLRSTDASRFPAVEVASE